MNCTSLKQINDDDDDGGDDDDALLFICSQSTS